MATFISLAISDTMFARDAKSLDLENLTADDVQNAIDSGALSALNPSHSVTIDAIHRKFGLDLPVPEKAPKVVLNIGDSLIVVQANLPRLAEGQVHSDEAIENAPIAFRRYTVR